MGGKINSPHTGVAMMNMTNSKALISFMTPIVKGELMEANPSLFAEYHGNACEQIASCCAYTLRQLGENGRWYIVNEILRAEVRGQTKTFNHSHALCERAEPDKGWWMLVDLPWVHGAIIQLDASPYRPPWAMRGVSTLSQVFQPFNEYLKQKEVFTQQEGWVLMDRVYKKFMRLKQQIK
jgi:hypothetical protein